MRRALLSLTASLAFAVPAFGHHGPGTFDLTQEVTRVGTLARIELINPHSWIYFDVTDENGEVSQHRCEMRSSHVLRRSGWSEDLFPIGQRVTIQAAPDRADPNSCYLKTVLFEDGSSMDRYGQYVQAPDGELREVLGPVVVPDIRRRALRRPSGEPNIAGDWAPEQLVMVDTRGAGGGLVPLGELEEAQEAFQARQAQARSGGGGGGGRGRGRGAAGPRQYGGTELTARGEREAASFAREDNPRFSCLTTNILFDWTFDGPVNRIIQRSDSLVIYYGQMNLRREIHLGMTEHPADIEPSRAGHSIGRWEGDTLVVDTVGFLPGVLSAPVRHSNQLHVVERFTLDPETLALTRSYTATDPVYLKGEYAGSDTVSIADAAYAEDHCLEQGFLNFSEQQAER